MAIDKFIGIAAASTAAVAIGVYAYYAIYKRNKGERCASRLSRSLLSIEACGGRQRQYLDEFKNDLGNKSFFMGEEMTNTDIKIFGQLASIYYVPKTDTVVSLLNEEYPSLVAWLERVKQELGRKDFRLQMT